MITNRIAQIPVHIKSALERIPVLTRFMYLVVIADGKQDSEELALIRKVCSYYALKPEVIETDFAYLSGLDIDHLNTLTKQNIAQLSIEKQIDLVAIGLLLANSNTKMDKREWKFIYELYARELELEFEAILNKQKYLRQQINSF